MKNIYFDHAATTSVKPEVLETMLPYFTKKYGNPSSIYSLGRETKKAIDDTREKVAKALNALPKEIFFTSGNEKKGKHIITTNIEHHAVLHTCKYLEKYGFEVTYVPVDNKGIVHVEDIEKAIRPDTILISVMFANNEIGTIQPIKEIGALAKGKGICLHTDAVQAIGNVPIDVKDMNIDMLSLSAHKFYGPKGVGVLYIRDGVRISPMIHGGAQERGKRAGTENVPGIVGLGEAIDLANENIDEYSIKLMNLRDRAIKEILEKIPYSRLNGDEKNRLPGNVNISFEFIEGESILLMLDMKGICASSGSACTSGSLDPSHVLLAIGLPHEIAHGSLRLTFGEENTDSDLDYLLETLPPIIEKLRAMSPLYDTFIKNGRI
ncbi:MAG: Cysteine desulfurase [candidate division WS6 bacterium GW2011_GWF1_36_8]|uniref:Cysteine desulfurase IscS n=1 Tax=candidate division WS6 bacterium GW2011_GWF1_36_8 TaxID=1619098 RepID=A0A0G0FNJ7_9BACT|nr:MAG: Cysteine desulfurase [candidate division WS6 bacterium GW2011_GWF1_36_8]